MAKILEYAKALVALVVSAVAYAIETEGPTVKAAVAAIVTAFLVYLVPNRDPAAPAGD